MRSVWSGHLAFGLVSIPVRLYPATEAKDVRFHLVDPATGRRVRYRRVVGREPEPAEEAAADEILEDDEDEPAAAGSHDTPSPGEGPYGAAAPRAGDGASEVEVPFEELARGYEVEPGEQVIITREELARVRPQRSRTIEIEDFVELMSIDPVYFEKSYVVAPEAGGGSDKPYVLLMRALERAGRVGIGRFVLRTKPHLVAIRARSGVLALETLFFGDEVRDLSALAPTEASVSIEGRELRLAEELVGMLAADWDPSAYGDTYRQDLLSLIATKTPRRPLEETVVAGATPPGSGAEALMEALRQSVEEAKRRTHSVRPGPTSEAV
jgi:DNA end-binding protein Ku